MDGFATVDDLKRRFRVLDPQEMSRAEALLEDASVMVEVELRIARIDVDDLDDLQMANIVRVCCDMVRRAMGKASEGDGATYAFGGNLMSTASGDLYMTNAERRSIGSLGSGKIAFVEA